MAPTIRLTVITGPHRNKRFCIRGHTNCVIGRAPDCAVQLAGENRDQLISRHHCELDVDGPCIRLEDLGSCNGTFLNGKNVRLIEQTLSGEGVKMDDEGVAVRAGDIVTLGGTSLRVDIVECPPLGTSLESVWQSGQTVKKDCPVEC